MPHFERFLVKVMRTWRDELDDPELKADVQAIIGQESHHAFNFIKWTEVMCRRYPKLAALDAHRGIAVHQDGGIGGRSGQLHPYLAFPRADHFQRPRSGDEPRNLRGAYYPDPGSPRVGEPHMYITVPAEPLQVDDQDIQPVQHGRRGFPVLSI